MATPTDVLDRLVDQHVELRLKDNRTVSGRLLGSDMHMNLVLDEAEERTPELTRRLGRVLLRGSTVISLDAASLPPKRR
ncbi:MAG: LSM domain-containing protein [Thermoplasmata archaeon]|nr:LSM domain-containing protein [Thermoplasmata archaeon]